MKRDHLMGYAPAMLGAEELADAGGFAMFMRHWVDPYPVGIPRRVEHEGECAMESATDCLAETPEQKEFRARIYTYPDGSQCEPTPKQAMRMHDLLLRRIKQASETLKEQTESDLFPESHGALKRRLAEAWERMGALESQLAKLHRDREREQSGAARQLANEFANAIVNAQSVAGTLTFVGAQGVGTASPVGLALTQQGSSLKP